MSNCSRLTDYLFLILIIGARLDSSGTVDGGVVAVHSYQHVSHTLEYRTKMRPTGLQTVEFGS